MRKREWLNGPCSQAFDAIHSRDQESIACSRFVTALLPWLFSSLEHWCWGRMQVLTRCSKCLKEHFRVRLPWSRPGELSCARWADGLATFLAAQLASTERKIPCHKAKARHFRGLCSPSSSKRPRCLALPLAWPYVPRPRRLHFRPPGPSRREWHLSAPEWTRILERMKRI